MKIAYLDCFSGISGDMNARRAGRRRRPGGKINEAIASLGLPGCRLVAREVRKHGFRATQVTVEYAPEHVHRHLHQILAMIEAGRLSPRQKGTAGRSSPGWPRPRPRSTAAAVEQVISTRWGGRFDRRHRGTAVGCDCWGWSGCTPPPVPTGTGRIRIAHGEFRRARPGHGRTVAGIPLAPSAIECELTTPTGAAILATLVESFGPLPAMTNATDRLRRRPTRSGASKPMFLRLLVGETSDEDAGSQVCVLETNLDDISGELIGYCIGRLWEAGALDVTRRPSK